MRPTRQVARLSERAATLAGFVATEDRGRSIAVFNLSFCTFSTPILYQRIPSSRSRTATKARTFNAIRTLSLHGVTSVQAQPSSFSAIPECQIFVMWLIFVAGELHHIDIIRGRLFAGRLARTTGTGMSTRKDTVGSDVVALGISGNTLVSWPLKQSTTACLLTHHPAHVGRAFG